MLKLKLNNRMSFYRGCDLVNTFKVIIGFILQIHMHFDVCAVLTSNQKQLQPEGEQMIPCVKMYACLSDCLLMNIEGQNIEKIKLQCTDTHKKWFL